MIQAVTEDEKTLGINAGALRDSASVTLANAYIDREVTDDGGARLLQFWRSDFYMWHKSVYIRQEPEIFRSRILHFLESLKIVVKGKIKKFQPEPRNVKNVIETLQNKCQAHVEQIPCWLDHHRPNAKDIISFRNGLLNIADCISDPRSLPTPPTPLWFDEQVLPYDWKADSRCPQWLTFLGNTIKNETLIALLQEWFGYCLTSDTSHQKLMMMIGPPRCGKGTIIRAMQRLIGKSNYASPPFYSLNERFGLEPLLGKRVACIPDAHLGKGADAVQVLDRLLQISGEDEVTVDRKNRTAVSSARLGVRFTIAANEAPDLPDASGAIIPRLLQIHFDESFAGREDLLLDTRLAPETPGIAAWAIEGLKRLRKVGRFSEPADASHLKNDVLRQSAPIHIFIQDRCELGADLKEHWTDVDDFWQKWRKWAEDNGHHPGTKEGLGRRLRTATMGKVYRVRSSRSGKQQYEYHGIKLLPDGELPWKDGAYEPKTDQF